MKRWTFLFPFIFRLALTAPNATGQSLSRYDAAIDHFTALQQQDSFLHYTQLKQQLARHSDSLGVWAWVAFDRRNFTEANHAVALQYLDQAQRDEWREPSGASEWEPFMYIAAARGYHLFHQGQVWLAIQAYEQARALYERYRYPDFDAVEMIYKPLGNHYTRLGDNEKALVVFQRAVEMGGSAETLAGLYNNMGLVYWNRGEWVAAGENLRRGLGLPGISREKKALLMGGLALVQQDSDDPVTAYSSALQALTLLPAMPKDPELVLLRARIRRTAGIAAIGAGVYGKARQLLDGALFDARRVSDPSANRDIGKTAIALSAWHLHNRDADAALAAANQALKAVLPGFKPVRLADNPAPTDFYEENTIFEALTGKANAARLKYAQTGEIAWLATALDCYQLCHTAETRLRSVFQYQSSKLWLQSAKRIREEAAMDVARILYEKTGDRRYMAAGFAIAERSKAALLMDALRDNLIRQRLAGQDARFGELAALERNAAEFRTKCLLEPESPELMRWRVWIDEIDARTIVLKQAIAASYPAMALPVQQLADTTDLLRQARFGPGELLVEYFVSGGELDEFVVSDGQIKAWRRIPYDALMQVQIRQFQAYFSNANAIINDPAGYLNAAFQVWQLLAPPGIEGAAGLVIIPDGPLSQIPFEALITQAPQAGMGLERAAYLIRQMPVRYAWSLASLLQQNAAGGKRTGSFMLGIAPLFLQGERGLAPLPASRNEWQAAGSWRPDAWMGTDANSGDFLKKAGQYTVLHLATHAYSTTTGETSPRIELADRSLLLPEIYALPLQAELVVLSACETGIGQDLKGEGVMSLSRAFAQAGASCIISSLWTVNDETTSRFFGDFYQALRGGQPISQSLRSAKLAYLDDPNIPAGLQTPYFWAGLVAVGSDRVIEGPGAPIWWYAALAALILGGVRLAWRYVRRAQRKTPEASAKPAI
jgi:hypothetical protein